MDIKFQEFTAYGRLNFGGRLLLVSMPLAARPVSEKNKNKLRRSTSVNKEPEEIEMLVFYYAGLGIQGLIRQR